MTIAHIILIAELQPSSGGDEKNSVVYMSEIRNSFVFPFRKEAFSRLPSPFEQ